MVIYTSLSIINSLIRTPKSVHQSSHSGALLSLQCAPKVTL